MNKRGMDTHLILWTFYLVLCILIFVWLTVYTNSEINGISSDQEASAKQIGLTLDAIYAANGDLDLTYFLNEPFIIKSEEGFLTVKKNEFSNLDFYIASQSKEHMNFEVTSDKLNINYKNGGLSVS